MTFRAVVDVARNWLEDYRLKVQANPPAKQFWSVTIYDNRTRGMIDTDQQRAELSTCSKLKKNAGGSIDLFSQKKEAPTGSITAAASS